jgi:hypothetical protein
MKFGWLAELFVSPIPPTRLGMNMSLANHASRAGSVRVTASDLIVGLIDGRTISAPLVWFPRLLDASPQQRARWQLLGNGVGIHWPEVDEDVSVEGLLRGVPAP